MIKNNSKSIKVRLTPATEPKNKDVYFVAYTYACLLAIFCLFQLFDFSGFVRIVIGFGLFNNLASAQAMAIFIVLVELLALPFLLRLSLPVWLRRLSMTSSWLVPKTWLFISIWLLANNIPANNIGVLGAKIILPVGIWAVTFSIGIGLLAAWASFGLWPKKQAH